MESAVSLWWVSYSISLTSSLVGTPPSEVVVVVIEGCGEGKNDKGTSTRNWTNVVVALAPGSGMQAPRLQSCDVGAR